jgi:hypothetical protein
MNEYPQTVLWIDPGGTTGFAWVEHTPDGYVFDFAQAVGTEAAARQAWKIINWDREEFDRSDPARVWVGWEQYIVTAGGGRSGNPAPALEVIGALKWLCYNAGARVLPAVPASHRAVMTTDALKAAGWYRPGVPHAMDAARHLGAWVLREQQRIRMDERSLQRRR